MSRLTRRQRRRWWGAAFALLWASLAVWVAAATTYTWQARGPAGTSGDRVVTVGAFEYLRVETTSVDVRGNPAGPEHARRWECHPGRAAVTMLILLVAGLGAVSGGVIAVRRGRLVGRCDECGYDLTGLRSTRCPECGEALEV